VSIAEKNNPSTPMHVKLGRLRFAFVGLCSEEAAFCSKRDLHIATGCNAGLDNRAFGTGCKACLDTTGNENPWYTVFISCGDGANTHKTLMQVRRYSANEPLAREFEQK